MSAADDMAPPEVRRYLRVATLLLLPATAGEVREELLADLYHLKVSGQVAGSSETEAWAAALRKFGSPWPLAFALAWVHHLRVARAALLAALLLGGAAYALHAEPFSAGPLPAEPLSTEPFHAVEVQK